MLSRAKILAIILFAAPLVLSACGGGGSSLTVEPPPQPEMQTCSDGTVIPATDSCPPPNYDTAEYQMNYGLESIHTREAYQRGYFGQGVTVAVVDSGMLTTHIDLRDRVVGGYDIIKKTVAISDPISSYWNSIGHGTFVAGIIGASRDGNGVHGVAPSVSIMPLQFGVSDGTVDTGGLRGDVQNAFTFAVDNGAHIINNSYGFIRNFVGTYQGKRYQATIPLLRPFFGGAQLRALLIPNIVRDNDVTFVWSAGNSGWRPGGRVRLCDSIDAGLVGRCPTVEKIITPEQFADGFVAERYVKTLPITNTVDGNDILGTRRFNLQSRSSFTDLTVSSPGFYGLLPTIPKFSGLIGSWLVVAATDEHDDIASFSNGCGGAKMWCLAAPGVHIHSAKGTGGNDYGVYNGTSFSAPHVSGALAILKSRLKTMPMDIVSFILLTTATDLCATEIGGDCKDGVDDIYGRGLLNISAAIHFQDDVIVNMKNDIIGNALLSGEPIKLPAGMSHLRKQLAGISAAVQLHDDVHYEIALADVLADDAETELPTLGQAAGDLLDDDKTVNQVAMNSLNENFFAAFNAKSERLQYLGATLGGWRFQYNVQCDDCKKSLWREFADDSFSGEINQPFFMNGNADGKHSFNIAMRGDGVRPFAVAGFDDGADYYQLGLRWNKTRGGLGWFGEVSQISEDDSIIGMRKNFFTKGRADTYQGKFSLSNTFNHFWKGFISYETAFINVRADGDSVMKDFSNLQARGWKAGVEGKSVWTARDKLRLMVSQPTSLSAGESVLRVNKTDISFIDRFYGEGQRRQTISGGDDVISWARKSPTIFALGYVLSPRDNIEVAVGVEHLTLDGRNNTAISAKVRWSF